MLLDPAPGSALVQDFLANVCARANGCAATIPKPILSWIAKAAVRLAFVRSLQCQSAGTRPLSEFSKCLRRSRMLSARTILSHLSAWQELFPLRSIARVCRSRVRQQVVWLSGIGQGRG